MRPHYASGQIEKLRTISYRAGKPLKCNTPPERRLSCGCNHQDEYIIRSSKWLFKIIYSDWCYTQLILTLNFAYGLSFTTNKKATYKSRCYGSITTEACWANPWHFLFEDRNGLTVRSTTCTPIGLCGFRQRPYLSANQWYDSPRPSDIFTLHDNQYISTVERA